MTKDKIKYKGYKTLMKKYPEFSNDLENFLHSQGVSKKIIKDIFTVVDGLLKEKESYRYFKHELGNISYETLFYFTAAFVSESLGYYPLKGLILWHSLSIVGIKNKIDLKTIYDRFDTIFDKKFEKKFSVHRIKRTLVPVLKIFIEKYGIERTEIYEIFQDIINTIGQGPMDYLDFMDVVYRVLKQYSRNVRKDEINYFFHLRKMIIRRVKI